ncbi:hypothetical protein ACWEQ7_22090 [Streptomyces sp. NPDC004069]
MVAVVAALPGAAALLLGLPAVFVALAVLGVLGAAVHGADAPAGLGHRHLRSVPCADLGVVLMKRADASLGIVVAGVVLIIGCRLITWWPGVILGAAMVLGVLVMKAAGRKSRGPRV